MEKKQAVLITGGVKNTGLAAAERFLADGRTVFITSRRKETAEKKAAELRAEYNADCYGLEFDPLRAKTECGQLFAEIADRGYRVDTLVCAHADPGFGQDTLTVDLSDWENVILTNVMGYYMPVRCMAAELKKENRRGGSVVLIGSTVGEEAVPRRSAYVASKGAEASMTKALALDLAGYGIRVNCVVAGPIRTERWEELSAEDAQNREKNIPLGAAIDPKQVAEAVWFLSSPAASGITGASLTVDGGLECVVPGAY